MDTRLTLTGKPFFSFKSLRSWVKIKNAKSNILKCKDSLTSIWTHKQTLAHMHTHTHTWRKILFLLDTHLRKTFKSEMWQWDFLWNPFFLREWESRIMIHLHKAIFHITTTTILPSARFCFGRMKERESKNPKLKKEEKTFYVTISISLFINPHILKKVVKNFGSVSESFNNVIGSTSYLHSHIFHNNFKNTVLIF